MRTFTLLFSAVVLSTSAMAQTVATFDDLTLSQPDTFYVHYSSSGTSDVGFNDGHAHFPCYYDTTGGYVVWDGFAYSNMTDSVTSGSANQYAAKTAIGYASTANYAAVSCFDPITYASSVHINLTGAAIGRHAEGFYVTNSTYAYNSMRDGDMFAHKFHSGDWFLLTIKGYNSGVPSADSVNFYLADFRFTDTTMNYIVKTWQFVNLDTLGNVDSLQFSLTSSDTSFGYMNTPSYFCIDNFTTRDIPTGIAATPQPAIARVYPNPATNTLYVDVNDNNLQQITVLDMAGNIVNTYAINQKQIAINTSSLPAGAYLLQMSGNGKTANVRFVKQ